MWSSDSINTDPTHVLFRGFIDYYFNTNGFDHVHDVIDTRHGKIVKLSEIPTKTEDPINGIDDRVRSQLRSSIFGILDPFDFSYVPSKNFSFETNHKTMLYHMADFLAELKDSSYDF